MQRSFLGLALVLGLVSAVGPFAIDMYLPALPTIGKSLGASPASVQATLIVFLLALGAGQVVYGPVSDMLGRKAPLYFGLALFGVGSIGCALARRGDADRAALRSRVGRLRRHGDPAGGGARPVDQQAAGERRCATATSWACR